MFKKSAIPYLVLSFAVVLAVIFICSSCAAYSGSFNLEPGQVKERTSNSEIKQFPDGTAIPEGYKYLTTANYKTGMVTVECGYDHMISEARKAVVQAGGDAFRLFNVKKPDYLTNTCYTGDILILKKIETM